MTNAEYFKTPAALAEAWNKYKELFQHIEDGMGVLKPVDDPFVFATKPADTAFTKGLEIGSLIQVKVNLHGEGIGLKWGVVEGHGSTLGGTRMLTFNKISVRFADKSKIELDVDVTGIGGPLQDESNMSVGDIKLPSIPTDVLKLTAACVNLDKCPLKKEGACLDE